MNTQTAITRDTPLMELAERYVVWMRDETRKTTKTRKTQGHQARMVCRYLTEQGITRAAAITGPLLHAFAKDMEAKQSRPRTVRSALLGTRAFCRWLVASGLIADDPAANVPFPTLDLVRRRVPSKQEVDALLSGAEQMYPPRRAIMAKAILHCFVFAGLRRMECLNLRPCDIDHKEGCICVWIGKGGKGRRVYVPDSTLDVLKAWQDERGECHHDRLWDYDGRRYLADVGLRTLFAEVRYKAGLKDAQWLTPHCLRHYYCSSLIHVGVNVEIIRAQMGHADLATTQMYIHSDSAQLRAAAARLDPNDEARDKKDPAISSIVRRARDESAQNQAKRGKSSASAFAWVE